MALYKFRIINIITCSVFTFNKLNDHDDDEHQSTMLDVFIEFEC